MKIFLLFAALTFGTTVFAEDLGLNVSVQNDRVVLIDSSARSCEQQITDPQHTNPDDIQGLSFNLKGFSLAWVGRNTFFPMYAAVFLHPDNNPGKVYEVHINRRQFAFAWIGAAKNPEPMQPNSKEHSTTACNFTVGGIQVADKTKSFTGTGHFYVYGYEQNEDGYVKYVAESVDFKFEYIAP